MLCKGAPFNQADVQVSKRIQATDDPIMVRTSKMLGSAKGALSLGQGISKQNSALCFCIAHLLPFTAVKHANAKAC